MCNLGPGHNNEVGKICLINNYYRLSRRGLCEEVVLHRSYLKVCLSRHLWNLTTYHVIFVQRWSFEGGHQVHDHFRDLIAMWPLYLEVVINQRHYLSIHLYKF